MESAPFAAVFLAPGFSDFLYSLQLPDLPTIPLSLRIPARRTWFWRGLYEKQGFAECQGSGYFFPPSPLPFTPHILREVPEGEEKYPA